MGVTRTLGGLLSFETEARRRIPGELGAARRATPTLLARSRDGMGVSARCVDWLRRQVDAAWDSLAFRFPSGSRSFGAMSRRRRRRRSAVLSTADGLPRHALHVRRHARRRSGFDCSGFVQYVYRQNGVTLPRTSRQQATTGHSLPAKLDGLRAGDLLFFSQHGDVVDHVAIYAGNDRILHSSSSGGGVRYDDLTTARGHWFTDRLVAVRRVLGDGATFVDPTIVAQLDQTQKLDPPDAAPKP